MANGTQVYTESTNKVVLVGGDDIGGTSGNPYNYSLLVHYDRTVATSACTIASGAELKAATAIAADTDLTLTYPMRPVENKVLRLAITTAQNGGAAISGDETVDIFGTTAIWHKLTGASASGQKAVPIADMTHNYQVGDTVILIDISAPSTYETDVIASISEGVSITLTNNNTNSYATGDIVGIYQTEQIDTHTPGFGTVWTTVPYGQIAILTFTGYDGTNTGKVDQPIWGRYWDFGNKNYQQDCFLDVGDGSTTTHFVDNSLHIVFSAFNTANGQYLIQTLANADVQFGTYVSEVPEKGCSFKSETTSYYSYMFGDAGTTNLYACKFLASSHNGRIFFRVTGDCIGCLLDEHVGLEVYSTTTILDTAAYGMANAIRFRGAASVDRFTSKGTDHCVRIMVDNLVASNVYGRAAVAEIYCQEKPDTEADIIDADFGAGAWTVVGDGTWSGDVNRKYTCNIEVADKDGTLIDDVTVLCEDKDSTEIFSELTGATNTGKIDEQNNIIYQVFTQNGAGADTATYSPHKFTFTHADYPDLIMPDVTVDGPIDWRIDMGQSTSDLEAIVNAQVLDVLNTDTFAEPGQGNPAATASLVAKIGYLYKFLRNKLTTTGTQISVYNDAGSVVDQKSTISDDATTFTRGEFGTGA